MLQVIELGRRMGCSFVYSRSGRLFDVGWVEQQSSSGRAARASGGNWCGRAEWRAAGGASAVHESEWVECGAFR